MTAFTPVPLAQQPAWLRQLHAVIEVYPPDPGTGYGAALCRWCAMTWPLPLARFEEEPHARGLWLLGVARHGMEHAAAGELLLDGDGEPIAEDDWQTEGLGWPS